LTETTDHKNSNKDKTQTDHRPIYSRNTKSLKLQWNVVQYSSNACTEFSQ